MSGAVEVTIKSRRVTVKGARGTLSREFKHVNVAFVVLGKGSIRVDMWFGNRLQLACLRTVTTHIENMIVGVTKVRAHRVHCAVVVCHFCECDVAPAPIWAACVCWRSRDESVTCASCIVLRVQGYCYRMRFAYAHFPINAQVLGSNPGATVEIRNFLGQRIVRKIKMLEGVSVVKSTDVKDQLELTGNDIELVSRSGAWLSQLVGVGVCPCARVSVCLCCVPACNGSDLNVALSLECLQPR